MKSFFNVEHLQQLTYERSTKWATFLENAKNIETLDEFPICEMESFYGEEVDERDSDNELDSMEDKDCDENRSVLRNLTNNQHLSLMLTSTINNTTEVEAEIVDLFNETMPIIHEHNRQLKETGFDKILSTFDKKKIEEKVGSWLNRHNSLFNGDASLLSDKNKIKHNKIDPLVMHKGNSRRIRSSRISNSSNQEESYSSDDSLQSGEIARYIRSSRAASLKNGTSNTTMIKTYRLVKSKRDALREKYACEKDNENDYHLKTTHHCHRIANSLEYHHNHYDLFKKSHNHKYEMRTMSSSVHKQKRKILRKRLVTQSYDTTHSSDSDCYDDYAKHVQSRKLTHCCNKYHCPIVRNSCSAVKVSSSIVKRTQRSAIKMSSARLNRIYYFSPYNLSKSLSSSTTSSNSFSRPLDTSCLVKTQRKGYTAIRPCKRESECGCRNDGKLCQEYLHITDTSTDDWYVENCDTPKKISKELSPHAKRTLLLGEQANNCSVDNENIQSDIQRKLEMNTESIESCSKSKPVEKTEKRKQKKNKIKNETETEKAEVEAKAEAPTADDSFERELQKAIQISKDLFEKEQQMKVKEDKNKNRKTRGRPKKLLMETTSQQEEDNVVGNLTNEQKRTQRKRKTNKMENNISDEEEVIKKSSEMLQPKGDKKVTKIDQVGKHECEVLKSQNGQQIINNTTEDTFLGNGRAQIICNSTAMSLNGEAYKRQITNPWLEATEAVNGNEISKINNKADNTHEDNRKTKSVKKSSKKNINSENVKNLKSTGCEQNPEATCRNISSCQTNDQANSTRGVGEEISRRTKRAKKTTRKYPMPEQSNNLTAMGSSQCQINDRNDSGSESSNKDNTALFLKPTKEHRIMQNAKEMKNKIRSSLQEQQSSKNDSQHDDRKQEKSTISSKTSVSSTINSSNNSSRVTSTTIRSPYAPSPLMQSYARNHSHAVLSDSDVDDVDDDALVTSTTNIELPTLTMDMLENMREKATTSHQARHNLLANAQHSHKGILIYSPHNSNLAFDHNIANDGYFTITKEHLSSVIGEKAADKFLKHYIGRKRFNSKSTIYYRPPTTRATNNNISSSSDSDDDLDSLGQYGDLYESLTES